MAEPLIDQNDADRSMMHHQSFGNLSSHSESVEPVDAAELQIVHWTL